MEDVKSDLSVFHRIDDYNEMSAPDFFSKAFRLFAYKGVMRARMERILNEEQGAGEVHRPQATPTGASTKPGELRKEVSLGSNIASHEKAMREFQMQKELGG